MSDLIWKIFTF